MGILTEWITEWLKGLLIEGIMGNLEGLFDTVNTRVGEISVQVGTTPAAWNAGVFSLIRQLSETVILPIAGLILTFVATYELIQMILEKNNMHEFDVANIYKWVFKTTCAILILSNTFNIVMAVFDVSQSVIASAAGIVTGATNITPDMLADLEMTLETMELGPLLGLFLQSFLIKFTMLALNIFIWPHDRDISADQFSPHPRGDALQPGAWHDGPELSALPVCRGLSGYADPRLRGHLCGAHSEDRHRWRSHRRDLGLYRLYGASVLHADENRDDLQKHLQRPLRKER